MTVRRRPPRGGVEVRLAGVLAAGLAMAAVWLRLGLPTPGCRLREWTGLPCSTCGSTRMLEALFAGDVAGAFAFNPLVFLALVGTCAWLAFALARRALGLPRLGLILERRERIAAIVVVTFLVLADWAYVIWIS